MQVIAVRCPACGGSYDGRLTSRIVTCEYCGTRFALTEDELVALGLTDANGDGFVDEDPEVALGEDTSHDPMDVFARETCVTSLKGVEDYYFKSSNKILRGLDIADGHEVYLIHDDTMFNSGKNGFAITSAGLYCREMGDRTAHFVSWDDFAKGGKPELADSYIRQDGMSVCYFSDNSDVLEDKLLPLYLRLYRHACKLA